MRGGEENLNFKPIRLSETGHAVWRSLASVKTSLLGWMSLDFGRTGLSNMHRCCAFSFALAGPFLLRIALFRWRKGHRSCIQRFAFLAFLAPHFSRTLCCGSLTTKFWKLHRVKPSKLAANAYCHVVHALQRSRARNRLPDSSPVSRRPTGCHRQVPHCAQRYQQTDDWRLPGWHSNAVSHAASEVY